MTDIAISHRLSFVLGAALVCAAILSAGLILCMWRWLRSYALARPNARSSHREPTPQGGGFAVVTAVLIVTWGVAAFPAAVLQEISPLLALTAAAILLAAVGALDDLRNLPVGARLALQCLAAVIVVAALPAGWHALPFGAGQNALWWVERAALIIGLVWFVNLVNFMDGIDWMTVAEVVPAAAAIVVLGYLGAVPPLPLIVATALLGATLGFAPFNRPVAKLFLGDVGSLPIGLLLGWLLLQVAGNGHIAAAMLLPLYYVVDATATLARRIAAGEPFWEAHRSHFYQRATDNGFTVAGIIAQVGLVNIVLAALALTTVARPEPAIIILSLAGGAALVIWLMRRFSHERS